MKLSRNLILASNSPRRREILHSAGFEFEVKIRDTLEIYSEELLPQNVPEYLAQLKAQAFENQLKGNIILAADTIVLLNGSILGKPKDADAAKVMLKAISGNMHTVISGVCISSEDYNHTFSDSTQVYFEELTDAKINYYIENFKPFDKAGSYGIQEWMGMIGIEKIHGSYYNVMGLPIQKVCKALERYRVLA